MKMALSFLLLVSLAVPAFPCSCPPWTIQAADLERIPAVFVAKLHSVKQSAAVPQPKELVVVSVRVLESWKGPAVGQEVIIATPSDGGLCGYDFEMAAARGDSVHLIFAGPARKGRWPWEKRTGWLATGICSGSGPLKYKHAERDSLIAWTATARAHQTLQPAPTLR